MEIVSPGKDTIRDEVLGRVLEGREVEKVADEAATMVTEFWIGPRALMRST